MVLITEIEDRKIAKPFLGGWRNKITGIEYFNAVSQTEPPPKNISWDNCCSIGVQTVETKDGSTQSSYDKTTQMWRCDSIRKLKEIWYSLSMRAFILLLIIFFVCSIFFLLLLFYYLLISYLLFFVNVILIRCKRRTDCNVSNTRDKYMTPKFYETYDDIQWRLDLNKRARIIQRNYRVYRLLKYIKDCARRYRDIMKECERHREERIIMYRYANPIKK